MSAEFDRNSIIQGNMLTNERMANPSSFASDTGVVRIKPTARLEDTSKTRMAGEVGTRAMELMTNPEAAASTESWMNQFGQSNQGAAFNQTKMELAQASAASQIAEGKGD